MALPEAEDPSVQVDEVLPEVEDYSVEVGVPPEAVLAEVSLEDGEDQEVPLEAAVDSSRPWPPWHFSFVLYIVPLSMVQALDGTVGG